MERDPYETNSVSDETGITTTPGSDNGDLSRFAWDEARNGSSYTQRDLYDYYESSNTIVDSSSRDLYGYFPENDPYATADLYQGRDFSPSYFSDGFEIVSDPYEKTVADEPVTRTTHSRPATDNRHHKKIGPGPQGVPGSPPDGYHAMKGKVPVGAVKMAHSLLGGDWGTETPFEVNGKRYMARVEPHYHPPGFKGGPNGWHKGVSVYEAN
jgi:hypothetical protein